MRKINPNNFHVATRSTSREINRQIALNLVRSYRCEGIGVVIPGMVDRSTSRIIYAPTLRWRDVEIRESLEAATGYPVQLENSGKACALAQIWATRGDAAAAGDLAF